MVALIKTFIFHVLNRYVAMANWRRVSAVSLAEIGRVIVGTRKVGAMVTHIHIIFGGGRRAPPGGHP